MKSRRVKDKQMRGEDDREVTHPVVTTRFLFSKAVIFVLFPTLPLGEGCVYNGAFFLTAAAQ